MQPDLSIILPAYKSAAILRKNLPLLLDYLKTLPLAYEVIVVDDGSEDAGQTQAVTEEFGCRFLANLHNSGKGAALRQGMLAAQGRIRLFTDADLPYELVNIEKFYWYLDFKEYHLAVGDRTLVGAHYYSEVPQARSWGSRVFSFIVSRFLLGKSFDTQCGIKGFRAETAQDLFSVARIDRFATDVEILFIALKRQYDIKRLPVRLRVWETSSISMMRDGFKMIQDLSRIYWYHLRGKYYVAEELAAVIDAYPGKLN